MQAVAAQIFLQTQRSACHTCMFVQTNSSTLLSAARARIRCVAGESMRVCTYNGAHCLDERGRSCYLDRPFVRGRLASEDKLPEPRSSAQVDATLAPPIPYIPLTSPPATRSPLRLPSLPWKSPALSPMYWPTSGFVVNTTGPTPTHPCRALCRQTGSPPMLPPSPPSPPSLPPSTPTSTLPHSVLHVLLVLLFVMGMCILAFVCITWRQEDTSPLPRRVSSTKTAVTIQSRRRLRQQVHPTTHGIPRPSSLQSTLVDPPSQVSRWTNRNAVVRDHGGGDLVLQRSSVPQGMRGSTVQRALNRGATKRGTAPSRAANLPPSAGPRMTLDFEHWDAMARMPVAPMQDVTNREFDIV